MNLPLHTAAPPAATLDNCDREPIHIPGSIQDHGALVAFDGDGVVRYASANAEDLLGCPLVPGSVLEGLLPQAPCSAVADKVREGLMALRGEAEVPMPAELQVGSRQFDVVLHISDKLLVAEFESRRHSSAELAVFAVQAHRAMEKLRRPRAIDDLLQLATDELRALTGFDRVMAYRFRPDDSGEVVAESCIPTLDPYRGRRYPASDIPAQARRLYVVNTLRLIADVGAPVVPLLQREAGPLDLSASILRSVSPIHIEYLSNMGVAASMSVSIVINGQLWGLLACHHMQPRQVPYSVRMACDVIAQVLSSNIQSSLLRAQTERTEAAATVRSRLIADILHSDDEYAALARHAAELCTALRAEAAVVATGAKLQLVGGIQEEAAQAILEWLGSGPDDVSPDRLFHTHALPRRMEALATRAAPWCGLLALPFDRERGGWALFLRREQIETIHWGGRPEKEVRPGPLGPRLTPRGSFELWKETVRATAEPWEGVELDIAGQVLDELQRAQHARHAELNRARTQLMAVLGHDLRDPLHSISMAARVLEKDGDASGRTGRLGQRIQSSSSRMQRLVSQVMDMSRLQSGLGLDLQLARTDLSALLADLVDEASTAHPDIELRTQLPPLLEASVDADRIAQVCVNLMSNARHHGRPGHPIHVCAHALPGGGAAIAVRNVAAPIADAIAGTLFSPFKASSTGNARNRSGMGLGLYIAHEIVRGHGGDIAYTYDDGHVVFSVRIPPAASGTIVGS
ncbi:GAF domain-containing protein [Paracidovorax citrulli]|nr:GAF domain-containing protein [Paracidovorax citrulli]QCX12728.1 Bacteriophytochrome [Paracidovorax citrulli]UEG44303.1 GAF domain-containing protein [Paracidovorax citrulli]UMT96985.1 GAF domain-containing protein [Paracidovorax citrulli]